MTVAKVLLVGWEHMCCGEVGRIGDTVTMSVFYWNARLVEQRHDYGNERHGQPVTGQVLAIEWRPGILRQLSDGSQSVDNYGPGVPLTTTTEEATTEEDSAAGASWAFEFTIETDDTLPGPA
jgi:hypothetical protein